MSKPDLDPSIPREFLCAINGHVMKEPVRSLKSGTTFEKATIELWLATRGSVCPITGETLTREDLREDDELRSKIMRYYHVLSAEIVIICIEFNVLISTAMCCCRYHIQQTSMREASNFNDDLYDF